VGRSDAFAFAQAIAGARSGHGSAAAAGADAITRPTPPCADESFGCGKGRQPAISMQHHAAIDAPLALGEDGQGVSTADRGRVETRRGAGSTGAYSFGDDPAKLNEAAWCRERRRPSARRHEAANRWGLHDMYGNVAEWCLDRYDAEAYRALTPGAIGPVLLPSDRRYPHVARGGSWDDEPARLRSAARRASNPEWNRRDPQSPQSIWWFTDATFVGLRVVRAFGEQESEGYRSSITRDSR
jgi:hypothetical protein